MKTKALIQIFKKLMVLIILVSLFTALSCSKRNDYKWMNYDETFCSDAWNFNTNNEVLKQNVVDYFKVKSVTIYDLEIFVSKEAELSTTCTNKTGRVIKCKLKGSNSSTMKSSSFYD